MGLDIMIVRELTGGIYFGQPRGVTQLESGERQGINTLVYTESEIDRICRVAFDRHEAGQAGLFGDKANVLECTELWREVASRVGKDYPEVELSHMYVDNAAMQLVKWPKQFDVMVTTNMFGDILSDCAAMLTGSIGMLPSASLDANGKVCTNRSMVPPRILPARASRTPWRRFCLWPCCCAIAWMRRLAERIEQAVNKVLDEGLRTPDIMSHGMTEVGCEQMGDAVVAVTSRHRA